MTSPDNIYDVIIIGGGPAGLSAAQYASRAKLKTIVLDKSSTAGALAYTNHIENYPGVLGPISGKELLDIFKKQKTFYCQRNVCSVYFVGLFYNEICNFIQGFFAQFGVFYFRDILFGNFYLFDSILCIH